MKTTLLPAIVAPSNNHATVNNAGIGILLLMLLSGAIFSINLTALSDLCTALESQWLNFTDYMSGFMAQAHPAQW